MIESGSTECPEELHVPERHGRLYREESMGIDGTCHNIIAVAKPIVRERIPQINLVLMVVFAFAIPFSVTAGTTVAGLLTGLWLIEGNFSRKFQEIRGNKVALAFVAYFLLSVVGLLWTTDMKWGLRMVGKNWKLMLMPILMTSITRDRINYYLEAYIYSIATLHIISYLNLIGLIHFTVSDRVTYNVLLAFAVYLVLNYLLFWKLSKLRQAMYTLLFFSMSINMFVTDGRMGWIAYFVMLCLILFQYFNKHFLKAVLLMAILIPLSLGFLYNYSKAFRGRIHDTWIGLEQFQLANPDDEVLRLTHYFNSLELFIKHPLIGVGTGDFPQEYKKINEINSPTLNAGTHPHNNYLLVLAQFGLLGFVVFMSIFYLQIRYSRSRKPGFPLSCDVFSEAGLKHLQLALPIFFLLIMLTDCYLLGHVTTLEFTYFSACLYKTSADIDLDKNRAS
jgi:O-antigen ligase